MERLSGKELAKQFEDFINGASEENMNDFVNGFMSMHNTLEQKGFGLILKVVIAMANKKYVDGRNAEAHKRAKLIVAGFKKETALSLLEENPNYWTKERAEEYVNADYFRMDSLPLI